MSDLPRDDDGRVAVPTVGEVADLRERVQHLERARLAEVGEFAVARLRLKPGDVLVVKGGPGRPTEEETAQVHETVTSILRDAGLDNQVMVTSSDVGLDVLTQNELHALDEEDIARAGAGGWPHEQDNPEP
jgi:hypothetical protein